MQVFKRPPNPLMFDLSKTAGDVAQWNTICRQMQFLPLFYVDHQWRHTEILAIRLFTSTQMSIRLAYPVVLQSENESRTITQLTALLYVMA